MQIKLPGCLHVNSKFDVANDKYIQGVWGIKGSSRGPLLVPYGVRDVKKAGFVAFRLPSRTCE